MINKRPRLGACDRSPAGAMANGLHRGIRRPTPRPESRATATALDRETAHQLEPMANRLHRGIRRPTPRPESRTNAHGLERGRFTSWSGGETAYTLVSVEPRQKPESRATATALERETAHQLEPMANRLRLGACDGSPAGAVAKPPTPWYQSNHGKSLNQAERPRLGAWTAHRLGAWTVHQLERWRTA